MQVHGVLFAAFSALGAIFLLGKAFSGTETMDLTPIPTTS